MEEYTITKKDFNKYFEGKNIITKENYIEYLEIKNKIFFPNFSQMSLRKFESV